MDSDSAHCSRCGGAMNLIRIEPAWQRFERRVFECRECGQSESYTASLRAPGAARTAVLCKRQHGAFL
jgi:hypothetical protein